MRLMQREHAGNKLITEYYNNMKVCRIQYGRPTVYMAKFFSGSLRKLGSTTTSRLLRIRLQSQYTIFSDQLIT